MYVRTEKDEGDPIKYTIYICIFMLTSQISAITRARDSIFGMNVAVVVVCMRRIKDTTF